MDRIHEIYSVERETPPKGKMWSWRRLTKIQTTTRQDHSWPEAWSRIGKAAQKKEKQEWAIEKPKLENARNLRGIYSIDPNDEEYNHVMKNARKKLETPVADPMPCRRSESSMVTGAVNLKRAKASEKNRKTRFHCNVEVHESKRPEWNLSRRKIMKTTLQAKDKIQYLITTWGTNSFLCRR